MEAIRPTTTRLTKGKKRSESRKGGTVQDLHELGKDYELDKKAFESDFFRLAGSQAMEATEFTLDD